MEADKVPKSMKDYNQASSMQLKAIEHGFENLLILNKNIRIIDDQLTIGDLGCSHGKNSMIAINQLLDLLEKNEPVAGKLEKLLVIHEDIPDNDFNQVQQCLDDKSISYLNHSLITLKNIKTKVEFLPKSFYSPLFDKGTIDVITCYNAIHWSSSYKNLTKGLLFLEDLETPENVDWFKKLSRDSLVDWLSLRYEELHSHGLITMNVFESGKVFHMINGAWDDYLNSKGFSHSDLDKVNIPVLIRPSSIIDDCLNEVKNKFKVLRRFHSRENYIWAKIHLNAVAYGSLFQGLSNYPNLFPTTESKNDFIEGYLDHYYNVMKFPEETDYGIMYLVLQKI